MNAKKALRLALLAGSCLAASTANAQLVVGNDQTNPSLWLVDISGATAPRELVNGTGGEVWCLAADDVGQMLYWTNGSTLWKAAYDLNNPLSVVQVGTITGVALTGLAYDTVDNMLVGRASSGFWQIDVNTAAATQLFAATAQDFGGFDFDPGTNAFYGTNDSTSTTLLPGGRGLYRIDKPLTSPTFTELAEYPNRLDTGAADIDIDGLAAGGGKLYLVNDVAAQGAYVWNIAAGAFEAPIATLPFTGTNGIFSGGAWAPSLLVPAVGADVGITKVSMPGTLVAPPGGDITYVVTVRNNGPEAAAGVAMSDALPAGLTFVSADNGATFANGTVSADIGAMAQGETRVFNIVVTTNQLGSYLNTATVSSTTTDANPTNNSASASTLVRGPEADVRSSVTGPSDCAVGVGGTASFTVNFENLGTETAENSRIVVTLPPDTTFLQSNPPLNPVGGQLTLDLGSVGVGGTGSLTVDVRADLSGLITLNASAETSTTDPNGANNASSFATLIQGGGPTSANAVGVITTLPALANSEVPNSGGARFTGTTTPGRPFRSPDASKWIMLWDTDQATTSDQVLVVGDSNGIRVAVQEGVTTLPTQQGSDVNGPPYFPQGTFDAVQGINNAGQFVFSGLDSRTGTADDGYVVRGNVDGTFSLVVQEAVTEAPPATGGQFFGSLRSGAHITSGGSVGFIHTIAPLATATNEFLMKDNGDTPLLQVGASSPGNQNGGTGYLLDDLDTSGAQIGSFFDAEHTSSITSGLLDSPVTTDDKVVLINGNVVIQEGYVLPNSALAGTVTAVHAVRMEADGTWFARGSNNDAADWVVRNALPIASKGEPITPGNPILWDDTGFANGFFMTLGGNNGDYVVGGLTTSGDTRADAVLVLNGATVLASEKDPVDADGNGVFDDNVFIRTFIDDRAFLTDTDLFVVVRLRDAAAALCGGTDTDIGQALIRIPLGGGGPSCDPDVNCDGSPDQGDVACMILAVAGDTACICQDPDFNLDGSADQGDVASIIGVVAGQPCP